MSIIDLNKIILKEGETKYGLMTESDAGYVIDTQTIINENHINDNDDKVERIFIKCILQRANVKNRNGRIYPREVLEREIQRYRTLIQSKSAYNEVDHPDRSIVSLKRDDLSHMVVDFEWKGDDLYGTLEIITSPAWHKQGSIHCAGDHIANLIRRGYKLGISSRGLGSLKNINGQNIVQDDFELICFDIVAAPSTPNAYLFQETSKNINESLKISNLNLNNEKLIKFLNKN